MKDILNSHPVSVLKKEISKTNIKGYSKLKKAELVSLMVKNKSNFSHIKMADKKSRKPREPKPAPKAKTPPKKSPPKKKTPSPPKAKTPPKKSPSPPKYKKLSDELKKKKASSTYESIGNQKFLENAIKLYKKKSITANQLQKMVDKASKEDGYERKIINLNTDDVKILRKQRSKEHDKRQELKKLNRGLPQELKDHINKFTGIHLYDMIQEARNMKGGKISEIKKELKEIQFKHRGGRAYSLEVNSKRDFENTLQEYLKTSTKDPESMFKEMYEYLKKYTSDRIVATTKAEDKRTKAYKNKDKTKVNVGNVEDYVYDNIGDVYGEYVESVQENQSYDGTYNYNMSESAWERLVEKTYRQIGTRFKKSISAFLKENKNKKFKNAEEAGEAWIKKYGDSNEFYDEMDSYL